MSVERTFVDTNILLYAYDPRDEARHRAAVAVLRELWEARAGVLSVQVMQEFAVNARRRLLAPLPSEQIAAILSTYRVWPIHRPELDDVLAAVDLQDRARISFWDAMILVAARRLGATRVYSEDLNAGQIFDGVRVINPLALGA